MNTLIRLGALAGILAGALVPLAPGRAAAQDGGAKDEPAKGDPGKDGGAPAPAKRKLPKDPSRPVATRIDESLLGIVGGSAAGRISSRANLRTAIEEWAADAKDDPLRSVKWWREALLRTLPSSNHKTGVQDLRIPFGQGREAHLWLSVPRSYSTKNLYPLLVTILDRDEDPRRILASAYGDVLKEWVIVAIPTDAKDVGFDVVKDPWMAGLGMRYAIENLRIDRDRVALDGRGVGANTAFALGAEWAVQFCGCVLRSPTVVPPLSANLGLLQPVLVPGEDGKFPEKALEAVTAAAPGGGEGGSPPAPLEGGKGLQDRVQKAILALPPRRISRPEVGSFSWAAQPQGGEVWAYWVWVFRPASAKKDRLVKVHFARDAAANAVELTGDNLGELILLLNDDVVDLDRELTVRVNGVEVWKGKAERTIDTALYWLGQTGERSLYVPAEIRFTVPDGASAPRKPGEAPPVKDEGQAPPPENGAPEKAGASPPRAPTEGEAPGETAPPPPPASEEPPDPGTGE